jgi:hypothetical protein
MVLLMVMVTMGDSDCDGDGDDDSDGDGDGNDTGETSARGTASSGLMLLLSVFPPKYAMMSSCT